MKKQEPEYKCFICERPDVPLEKWDLDSLKLIYGDGQREDFACFKLCDTHIEYCKNRIPELELLSPKKYILKKEDPPAFIPPIPKEPIKNWQDREPNDGSLIE